MNGTLLTVFVGLTALAIVVQMGVLIALYLTSKKTAARLETISSEIKEDLIPMIREARTMLEQSGPKVRETVENLTAISTTLRQQTERINATAADAVDRVRLQVLRADQMATRALDRVEETTTTIQNAVASPVRQLSALLTGVLAGVAEFSGTRKLHRQKSAMPRDEMFI